MTLYQGYKLEVEYHDEFICDELRQELIDLIIPLLIIKYENLEAKKRHNICFGEDYKISFKGVDLVRESVKRNGKIWWPEPILMLKQTLQDHTGDTYNTCFIQYYPSGNVGISKHFDSEVAKGTSICSVSIGETRSFTLTPGKYVPNDSDMRLTLKDKSLLILKPPTNNYWLHSLDTDDTDAWRFSIIFRDNDIRK